VPRAAAIVAAGLQASGFMAAFVFCIVLAGCG